MKQRQQSGRKSSPGQFTMPVELAASTLDAALVQSNTRLFMAALTKVIRARGGFTRTARSTGLNRTGLYHILSELGNPSLSTLVAVLSAASLRLSVVPADNSKGFDSDVLAGATEQTGSEI